MSTERDVDWFVKARFGMFIHYGLYSILGRGEWAMNRERLSKTDMLALADQWDPKNFNADELCQLAVSTGMRYINLTTMHHDGFRLYDTELSDFNSVAYCGRDLVDELVTAAREHGLRVSLYHSLNNWTDSPDACDALESKDAHAEFIANTHARIKELVTRFNPIDVLWYDGWWPFNIDGWQSEKMNTMVSEIQPHILFNGRNCLPGDFGTPEGHMSAPSPWRPWEGCITFNDHWSFHRGDHNWKSPSDIVSLLATAASSRGNLMFNIGPKADGSVPQESIDILNAVGKWMTLHDECIFDTDMFTYGLESRDGHNGDWLHSGMFTLKGKSLYHLVRYWVGSELVVSGLQTKVNAVSLIGHDTALTFEQSDEKVIIRGLPEEAPDSVCPVVRLDCDDIPVMQLGGGMRIPNVPHPPYDPAPSDIAH
jgi:alpha-L-fucosidase